MFATPAGQATSVPRSIDLKPQRPLAVFGVYDPKPTFVWAFFVRQGKTFSGEAVLSLC